MRLLESAVFPNKYYSPTNVIYQMFNVECVTQNTKKETVI